MIDTEDRFLPYLLPVDLYLEMSNYEPTVKNLKRAKSKERELYIWAIGWFVAACVFIFTSNSMLVTLAGVALLIVAYLHLHLAHFWRKRKTEAQGLLEAIASLPKRFRESIK